MKTLMILILANLLILPLSYAKGDGHKEMQRKIFKQLDLTKDQRKQLKTMRESRKGVMKGLRSTKKEKREKMLMAMKGDTPEAELRAMHKEMSELHGKMKDQRFEKMLSIRKIGSSAVSVGKNS